MTRNQKRRSLSLRLPTCMTVAGMIHLVIVFAAAMPAAVRRGKWYFEISNLHGAGGLVFVN